MRSTPQRLWLCTQPVDMRCSFDGLASVVRQRLGGNPLSGDGYVFVNRRRTMMRVLYFEPGGYCLWSKRLEQGHFAMPQVGDQPARALSATVFESLLEGLDIEVKKQRKRWRSSVHQGAASATIKA
jgi:transposase